MRAIRIAWLITDNPGERRMRSAAAIAASVAPETATPTSAFFSAGASFTPSPVIATICPPFCSLSIIKYLSSGITCENPLASSINLIISDSCFLIKPSGNFVSFSRSFTSFDICRPNPFTSFSDARLFIFSYSPLAIISLKAVNSLEGSALLNSEVSKILEPIFNKSAICAAIA